MTPAPAIAQLPPDLRQAFDDLAADAAGPFGPTPLAHLMLAHLVLFAELRRLGASWAQIAELLAAHGIAGGDGAFTADVVRATYARATKSIDPAERKPTQRNATKHDETDRNAMMRAETRRSAAEGNDVKPDETADEALIRRASLIDKPWHMR